MSVVFPDDEPARRSAFDDACDHELARMKESFPTCDIRIERDEANMRWRTVVTPPFVSPIKGCQS